MAITVPGLSFAPLFWIYHDSWKYLRSVGGGAFVDMNHFGHLHFFMPGFNIHQASGDAFTGKQQFNFEIIDQWGPRSGDPNQQLQYRVVGLPRWYFRVEEVWRRVYVQQWDERLSIPEGTIVGRRGIKYDASSQGHTFGPFREGRGFAPVYIEGARALPVEYFHTDARSQAARDNYIKDKYRAFDGQTVKPFGDGSAYDLPADGVKPIDGGPNWADGLYISPTLEYQKVVQLDWERLPGYAAKNDIDDERFGDGWSISLTIPFTDPLTGKYRSPFGPDQGVCMPPGNYYNNLVLPENQLRYRVADNSPPGPGETTGGYDYNNKPFGLKDSQSGQLVQFNDPYGANDGKWVQQCLGGMIRAKAQVTIESKLGGRQDTWIETTQYLPLDQFAGTDQDLGAA